MKKAPVGRSKPYKRQACAFIFHHSSKQVKTSNANGLLYDEDVPPHAEQLGEPSSLFREPTQSFPVQVSFVVKDAGEDDEGTHLVEVGSFS